MFLNRLQIKDYSKPRSSLAFKDLDISFERDLEPSIFVIAGSQGCGKTSLLKILYDPRAQVFVNAKVAIDESEGETLLVLHDHGEGIQFWRKALLYNDLGTSPFDSSKSLAQNRTDELIRFCSNAESSIILLDNPDLGLHPDQQYQLCVDLGKINNGNQFIVATHSTDFCEALTPAHVKMIS
jgi:predicted ATPase